MPELDPLDHLRCCTSKLVAQRLRSDAAVISRLAGLILEATSLGCSHRAIHEAIAAGGLVTTWNTYRVSLKRARKARRAAHAAFGADPAEGISPVKEDAPAGQADASDLPEERPSPKGGIAQVSEEQRASATSSTVEVLEALQRARRVASKDYSRAAREQGRQRGRSCIPGTFPKESP